MIIQPSGSINGLILVLIIFQHLYLFSSLFLRPPPRWKGICVLSFLLLQAFNIRSPSLYVWSPFRGFSSMVEMVFRSVILIHLFWRSGMPSDSI